MIGTVGILNVGGGDTKLSFDKTNPAERIRAARIVRDMLRRGYMLLVEDEGQWVRATAFDEEKCEYVIADYDPAAGERCTCPPDGVSMDCAQHGAEPLGETLKPAEEPPRRKRGRPKKVDSLKTRAVAVGRTAGG